MPRKLGQLVVLAALVGLMAAQAAAGTITWGVPTTASADTDVSTLGTLDYAYIVGDQFSGAVNGVTFAAADTFVSGGIASNEGTPNFFMSSAPNAYSEFDGGAPITGLSASYRYILANAGYSNGGTSTVTLSNLTPGTSYEVEAWVNDSRNVGRSETFDGTGPMLSFDASNTTGGPGQFVIGTFTAAVSGSQSFTITPVGSGGVAQLNDIEVRTLPVPEPASFTLLLAGAVALGIWRLRRKA